MEYFQNFNYNTHTKRCGHAGLFEVDEYVFASKEAGIKSLGFSDHCPLTTLEYQDINYRMHLSEIDNYINEINALKEKHKDIEILSGFEAEYDSLHNLFLSELRSKVDYMVLGEHFIPDVKREGNSDYPTVYAHEVCAAMESGIFDIVAHPDIFMNYSETFTRIEDRDKFIENAKDAAQIICEKSKELNIPLEINLHGIVNNKSYPSKLFWEICEKVGSPVIYGVDAHSPKELIAMKDNMKKAEAQTGYANLNLFEYYNPSIARKSNAILDIKLKETIESALTYETMLNNKTIKNILNNMPFDYSDKEMVEYRIKEELGNLKSNLEVSSMVKNRESLEESSYIARDDRLSFEEKKFYTNRIKDGIFKSSEVLNNRLDSIDKLAQYVEKALSIGASSKDEIISIVSKLTEINTTNSKEKAHFYIDMVNDFYKQKLEEGGMEKGSKLVKTNPLFGSFDNEASPFLWSSDGFINIMALAMIITFILGVGVGIAMMLLGI